MNDEKLRKSIEINIATEGSTINNSTIVVAQNYHSNSSQIGNVYDHFTVEERYRQQVIGLYNEPDLRGLPGNSFRFSQITLEHLFVKLDLEITRTNIQESSPAKDKASHPNEKADNTESLAQSESEEEVSTNNSTGELRQHHAEKPTDADTIETVTISELLTRHTNVAILGTPGSGKTTITRWLAVVFAQQNQSKPENLGVSFTSPKLPILIELRRFSDRLLRATSPNLLVEIAEFISSDGNFTGTPAKFIQNAIEAGQCLLIFDGLDEVFDLSARQRFGESIRALLRNINANSEKNICIVTSRPHGYDHSLLGSFNRCIIKPFSFEDSASFLKRWFFNSYGESFLEAANALVKVIEKQERLKQLSTSPLLCTILAIVYHNNLSENRLLPDRRVQLYEACCETLLKRREQNRFPNQYDPIKEFGTLERVYHLLAALAHWLHYDKEDVIAHKDEFVETLASILATDQLLPIGDESRQKSRRLLDFLCERSGLLQERGDGTVEFIHPTFQEYLTARHIANLPYPDYIDVIMPNLHNSWWYEVHLLTISFLGSNEKNSEKLSNLVTTILTSTYSRTRFFLPFYPITLRFREASKWIGRKMHNWSYEGKIDWLLDRNLELVTTSLIDCLPSVLNERTRQYLENLVTRKLFEVLTDKGCRDYDSLYQYISTEPQMANKVLLNSLNDFHTKIRTLDILEKQGQIPRQILPELINLLLLIKRRQVEKSAGYPQLSNNRLIFSMQMLSISWKAWSQDRHLDQNDLWDTAQRIRYLLYKHVADFPEIVSALKSTVKDENQETRFVSAILLGKLGYTTSETVMLLLGVLKTWRKEKSTIALEILSNLNSTTPEIIEILTSALDEEDWDVRFGAARGLIALQKVTDRLIYELLRLFGETYEGRDLVINTFTEFPDVQPNTNTLLQYLEDPEESVSLAAILLLEKYPQPTPKVLEKMLGLYSKPDWPWSDHIKTYLYGLTDPDPDLISSILPFLDDPGEFVMHLARHILLHCKELPDYALVKIISTLPRSPLYPDVVKMVSRAIIRYTPKTLELITSLINLSVTEPLFFRGCYIYPLSRMSREHVEYVAPQLILSIEDQDWNKCSPIIELLSKTESVKPKIAGLISRFLKTESSDWGKQQIINEIVRMKIVSPELDDLVVNIIVHSEVYLWSDHIIEAYRLSPKLLSDLLQLLSSKSDEVRCRKVGLLAKLAKITSQKLDVVLGSIGVANLDAIKAFIQSSIDGIESMEAEILTHICTIVNSDDASLYYWLIAGIDILKNPTPEVITTLFNSMDYEQDIEKRVLSDLINVLHGNPSSLTDALMRGLRRSRIALIMFKQLNLASFEVMNMLLYSLEHRNISIRLESAIKLAQQKHSSPQVIQVLMEKLHKREWQSAEPQWHRNLNWSNDYEIAMLLCENYSHVVDEVKEVLMLAFTEFSGYARHTIHRLTQMNVLPIPLVDLVLVALKSQDTFVRQEASLILLQELPTTLEIVTGLLAAIKDDDEMVRMRSSLALTKLDKPTPEAVALLKQEMQSSDENLRRTIAQVLVNMNEATDEDIDLLIDTISEEEWWFVREGESNKREYIRERRKIAFESLCNLKHKPIAVLSLLIHHLSLKNYPPPSIEKAALTGLMTLNSLTQDIVKLIFQQFSGSTASDFKYTRALGQLFEQPKLITNDVVTWLMDEFVADAEWQVRPLITRILNTHKKIPTELVEILLVPQDFGENWGWNYRVREALDALTFGSPAVVAVLLNALESNVYEVHNRAIVLFDKLRQIDIDSIPLLIANISTRNYSQRSTIINFIGRMANDHSTLIPSLTNALNDDDIIVRESAVKSLVALNLASDEITVPLVKMLKFRPINQEILSAIGQLKFDSPKHISLLLPGLSKYLHHSSDDMRIACRNSLEQLLVGRPLPSYRWRSIYQREDRRQLLHFWAHWLVLAFCVGSVAFGLTYLNENNEVLKWFSLLGGLLGIAASIAQIIGKSLQNPFERRNSRRT